ncbi:unnamed protein product [Strongylus vulgaris]|uniref:Nematode cuticle collagen N-terminal domain-containing protein n=1 Tax=Strongylus vulgaris TaxID=40348 RepID=A0A3P7HYP7_STRVU|nr:unnamed protein product [Strongylus vulgaris]
MQETSFVVTVSLAAGAISLIGSLLLLPRLYWEMVDLKEEVFGAVESFKVETDSSWIELMTVQVSHSPPSKPRENPLVSRVKRTVSFAGLPEWCHCDLVPTCPPGPPGPPGPAGEPGSKYINSN